MTFRSHVDKSIKGNNFRYNDFYIEFLLKYQLQLYKALVFNVFRMRSIDLYINLPYDNWLNLLTHFKPKLERLEQQKRPK